MGYDTHCSFTTLLQRHVNLRLTAEPDASCLLADTPCKPSFTIQITSDDPVNVSRFLLLLSFLP